MSPPALADQVQPTPVAQATSAPPAVIAIQAASPFTASVEAVRGALAADSSTAPFSLSVTAKQDRILITGQLVGVVDLFRVEQVVRRAAGDLRVDLSEIRLADQYVVKPGDTLWDISIQVYGTPRFVRSIARANNLSTSAILRSGLILVMPGP
jgi:nucleoid-associated protein YgaU